MANLGIIKQLMKEQGISNVEMSNYLGITPQGFAKIIRENSTKIDTLEDIAKKLKVSVTVFFEDEGKERNKLSLIHRPKLPDKIIDNQTIKLYELDAAANLNTLNLEASREFAENIQVPNAPKCDGATYIKGDSMYPLLKSGDIVAFKQVHNIDYILYGEMYLVSYTIDGDDYLVVKFVCKSEKEGHVKLVSQNEYHAPRDIPVSSIRYLGIIKISIRLNSSI